MMKRLILVPLLALIVFACKKPTPEPVNPPINDTIPIVDTTIIDTIITDTMEDNYTEYYYNGTLIVPESAIATSKNGLLSFIILWHDTADFDFNSHIKHGINLYVFEFNGEGEYIIPDTVISPSESTKFALNSDEDGYLTSYGCTGSSNSVIEITNISIVDALLDSTQNTISGTFSGDLCNGSTQISITNG